MALSVFCRNGHKVVNNQRSHSCSSRNLPGSIVTSFIQHQAPVNENWIKSLISNALIFAIYYKLRLTQTIRHKLIMVIEFVDFVENKYICLK